MFFELEDNLCQRYKSLNPFQIRKEKSGEVFLLIRRINDHNARKKGVAPSDTVWQDKAGNTHIRRKATNDSWY